MTDSAHAHSNPSPSLGVGAWCNGSRDDPGCGHFVPLNAFTPYRADYFEGYLVDRRGLRSRLMKATAVVDALAMAATNPNEKRRLEGKSEGVRLALSYLNDERGSDGTS